MLGTRLDEALQQLLRNFKISVIIFCTQKAAAFHSQNRNIIFLLYLACHGFHIVTDNTGNAGIGNHQAFWLIGFNGKAQTFFQTRHTAENCVLFLHLAAEQRNGAPLLAFILGKRAVLGIDIHRACYMSTGTRAVKNYYSAVHVGNSAPHARHAAAAAFACTVKASCFNCHIRPPAFQAPQSSSA